MNETKPERNLPPPEGALLGAELARLTEAKVEDYYRRFPKAKERCKSCAFRLGTVPNRCLTTVADALKCTMETVPFYCHEHLVETNEPTQLCAGFAIAISTDDPCAKPIKMPWDFSQ